MIPIYFRDKINKTHSLKLPYLSLKTESLRKAFNVVEQKVSPQTSVQITLFKIQNRTLSFLIIPDTVQHNLRGLCLNNHLKWVHSFLK